MLATARIRSGSSLPAARAEAGVLGSWTNRHRGFHDMRMTPAVLRSKIVYMSMEIGLDPAVPTYSGGLGVLAGDVLRSAADLHVPILGMTLLHRKGYFRQHLSPTGVQSESPVDW